MVQEVRNHQKKTYLYEPESFRPLALVQDEEVYHYHLDHLGTPRELTNQGGHIVWKARYKTYGNVAVKEVDEIDNPIRFQGQYFDEETGLHYSRHRYYNPSTGQFTTQDPIGLLGGTNSYQYAPNPVQWIDPMGLTAQKEDPSRQMEAIARPRTQQSQLALPAPNESNPWMSGEPLIGDVVGDEGLNVYRKPTATSPSRKWTKSTTPSASRANTSTKKPGYTTTAIGITIPLRGSSPRRTQLGCWVGPIVTSMRRTRFNGLIL